MRSKSGFWIAQICPEIGKITMILKFADMMSLSNIFFVVIVFLYLSLLTETSFMLISSLASNI